MCTPRNRRGRGPGTQGRIHRDNVGKVPLAAGAGSNLQRLLERGLGRRRGEPSGIDEWVCKSYDRGVMSSQEAVHVSLMEVTPTSGKGTLGTWWFHVQRGGRTQSRHKPTHEMELSCEQTIRSRGVCAPALEPRGEGEGSRTRGQGFKPDLGNSAVRHYRGASENVAMAELRTHLATERVRVVALRLKQTRPSSIPTIGPQAPHLE